MLVLVGNDLGEYGCRVSSTIGHVRAAGVFRRLKRSQVGPGLGKGYGVLPPRRMS